MDVLTALAGRPRRAYARPVTPLPQDDPERLSTRERIRPPEPEQRPERAERSPLARLAADVGNHAFTTSVARSPLARDATQGEGIREDGTVHPEVQAAIDTSRGGGASLDPGVPVPAPSSLGDLSDVRVHTDDSADR